MTSQGSLRWFWFCLYGVGLLVAVAQFVVLLVDVVEGVKRMERKDLDVKYCNSDRSYGADTFETDDDNKGVVTQWGIFLGLVLFVLSNIAHNQISAMGLYSDGLVTWQWASRPERWRLALKDNWKLRWGLKVVLFLADLVIVGLCVLVTAAEYNSSSQCVELVVLTPSAAEALCNFFGWVAIAAIFVTIGVGVLIHALKCLLPKSVTRSSGYSTYEGTFKKYAVRAILGVLALTLVVTMVWGLVYGVLVSVNQLKYALTTIPDTVIKGFEGLLEVFL